MQTNEQQNILPLAFLTLGIHYLIFIETVIDETVKQGNAHVLISNHHMTEDERHEKTRWSDINVMNPILFNLYHGLELIIKGLLFVHNKSVTPKHKLPDLHFQLSKIPNDQFSTEAKSILSKYFNTVLLPNFLRNFLLTNELKIDDLYAALRYPADKNFKNIYSYFDLHYKGPEVTEFFKELKKDMVSLRTAVVQHSRQYDI